MQQQKQTYKSQQQASGLGENLLYQSEEQPLSPVPLYEEQPQETDTGEAPEDKIVNKMKRYIQQKENRWTAKPNIFSKFRALFINNLIHSSRQYCTNVCQIIFPILALFLPTIMTLLLNFSPAIPPMPGFIREQQFSPYYYLQGYGLEDCCDFRYNYSKRDIPLFCEQAGYYSAPYVYAVAENLEPGSEPAGSLTWAGEKSGFLGSLPQQYTRGNRGNCTYAPYFNRYDSAAMIDDAYITNKTAQGAWCKQNGRYYECDAPDIVPVGASTTFQFVSPSERRMKYTVQANSDYYQAPSLVMWRIFQGLFNKVKHVASTIATARGLTASFGGSFVGIEFASFISNAGFLIMFPLSISFLLPVFLSHNVYEKKKGLVEFVKMYGVTETEYEFNRSLFDYGLYLIILIMTTIIGVVSRHSFFWSGSPLYYIPLLLIWGVTLISMSNTGALVISNSRTATGLGYLAVLFTMLVAGIVNVFVLDTQMAPWYYMLVPPFAFTRIFAVIMFQYMPSAAPVGQYDILICFAYLIGETLLLLFIGSKIPFRIVSWCYYKITRGIRSLFVKRQRTTYAAVDIESNASGYYTAEAAAKHGISSQETMDEDVLFEREKVMSGNVRPESIVVIRNLSKTFGTLFSHRSKKAVDDICLSLHGDECQLFGLLGPNGAGKTTTIQMLSGLLSPSSGTAYIGGNDICTDLNKARKMIGICPQFDIYWDSLTVEEHLLFFARLRGVSILEERKHVKKIIEEVGLEEARRRYASKLSGGMKRRLSIAISLIGNPHVVFLDEPTSGLDPASKRGVWDVVLKARQNRCIILTTHSMEEAEALCQRIGIVAGGKLRCLGNLVHLKSKFGSGYKITITCDTQNEKRVKEYISRVLPNSHLENSYARTHFYRVKTEDVQLGSFFKEINEQGGKVGIKDYSINQASLEEVFLNIAEKFN